MAFEKKSGEINVLRNIFRAFESKNYVNYFIGQGISLVGTWLQYTAMGWLVYRLTKSPFLLGLVGFSGQFPSFLLASFAGVLADRWDRQNIMIATQIALMILSLILAILVLTNTVTVWHVIIISILFGIAGAFDMPTRHSFVLDMVERKELLGNAIALNSTLFNAARLIGPSVAGIIISITGEGLCFLLNAMSFIAIIIPLFTMKIKKAKNNSKKTNMLEGLKEGYSYAFSWGPIRAILALVGIASIAGMPYGVLMPIFAKEIFHGNPKTLGFLMAFSGMGAMTAAILLASQKSQKGLGKNIPLGVGLFGAGLIAFSCSKILWVSYIMLFFSGFGMMISFTSSNTLLQTIVEGDKRGRVMSLYTMAFMGMLPIGSILSGMMANRIGAPATLLSGGIICIAGALIFSRSLIALKQQV